jgi:hypothetical protein
MWHCASVSALAPELGVDRMVLYHWRRLQANEPFSTFFRLLMVCRECAVRFGPKCVNVLRLDTGSKRFRACSDNIRMAGVP